MDIRELARASKIASEGDREDLSGPALRTFLSIARLWGLSVDEQMILLGAPARPTFFRWKKDPDIMLPKDVLERISHILAIYRALQILLPDEAAADAWVRRPNQDPPFSGRSALDRMLSGKVTDLLVVRQYLDARCAGWT